jgi:glycosyltransferase involved in cell wall biosynthesis
MPLVRILDFRGTYKGGGGPDKTILNSAAQHDKSRVYIQVLYLRNPADKEYSIDKWAADLGANYLDVFDRKLIDRKCIAEIKKIIKEQNINLIHSHDEKTLLYGWIIKRAMPHIRIMYTCHLHSPYVRKDFDSLTSYLNFKLRRKVQVSLMKQYDKPLLAVSHHTKKCMIDDGLHEKDIEILHNGIDINAWRAELGTPVLKEELGVGPDEFLVGTVARIAQQHKDLSTFYRVAAEVSKKMPKVKFVIVGDGHGDEMAKAKRRVAELGMGRTFFFTGHRTDLLDIYTSLDVFLMTSLTEGLPNTVLEAMALQVPVVSTIVAGVPELISHGETGFLAPIRDVDGLSNHVTQLLSDSSLRHQFGQKARRRIEDSFSFADRVRKMEDYYERFVGNFSG